jgi:flagellar motor switch protein FliG
MTRDEFNAEYYKVSARAFQLSEKARREGLLALEEEVDSDKLNQRDIFEYGLRFVVDGTDASIIRDLLENIIEQEEDKYTRRLMVIKLEAALSIHAGDNPRITAYKLNTYTDLTLTDDPIIQKIMNEEDDKGKFSEDEIDALIGGYNKKADVEEPEVTDFDILGTLDNRSIQRVIREVDSTELGMALKSAKKETFKAILRNMSKRAAKMLVEDMEYMGPVLLRDVKEAQKKIVCIMQHLEDTGEIIIPRFGQDVV